MPKCTWTTINDALFKVLWGGSVLNPNKAGDAIVIDRLNTKLASDNRVWANLITIGDGVMLVVKRP